jgi:hypothetical protein
MRCDVPSITPQAETRAPQNKGGLEITITPVNYTAQQHETVTNKQVRQPASDEIIFGNHGYVYVERTTTTTLGATPGQIRFLVKINNQMARVFHGAGTVVQFNVGGQIQPVDQRGYTNVQGAIIPPRQEQQLEIVGPPLSALKEKKGIIGVFLYDVVTNQNDAGVVTEKQNFQWYFDYTIETHEEQVPATHTQLVKMTPLQYQQEMIRESQEQAMQGRRPNGTAPQPGNYSPAGPPQ